jgi:hypothetical protein
MFMKIGDITEKIKDNIQSVALGGGVYQIGVPVCYIDGTPITVGVKLVQDTEVVLERGEDAENMGLLSTSDEYTFMDMGSVIQRFGEVQGIEGIIQTACDRNHVHFDGEFITLEADTATTNSKLSRYLRTMLEIEMRVGDIVGKTTKDTHAKDKFMEYLTKRNQE